MSVDEDLAGSAAVEPAAEAAACGSREAPSDDADAQQQQPLAAGGPDCSDWDDDDDDDVTGSESEWEAAGAHAGPLLTPEEEEEKKLRILRCCTPLVKVRATAVGKPCGVAGSNSCGMHTSQLLSCLSLTRVLHPLRPPPLAGDSWRRQ